MRVQPLRRLRRLLRFLLALRLLVKLRHPVGAAVLFNAPIGGDGSLDGA